MFQVRSLKKLLIKRKKLLDKEEYKDYLDIEKDWGKHILRAVKNLLTGSKDYPKITKDSKYGE